jgi:predicted PurR-regulated permease PerM
MIQDDRQPAPKKEPTFPEKVWITGGIFALIVLLIWLAGAIFNVLLLILAGILIAVFFRGLSGLIQRKAKLSSKASMAIAVLTTLILLVLLFWMIGSKAQAQLAELRETLPKTIDNAKAQLNKSSMGRAAVEKISDPQTAKSAQGSATRFFRSSFTVLGDVYVIIFLGIFFTVAPASYKKGIINLVPPKGKAEAESILDETGESLKKWLKGMLFAMLVVFILTSIGLVSLGVPMWLALALIAGLLNFIPNFGPLIAMIPAVLVALMQSPTTALLVACLYILIQTIESNFITPMVQKRMLDIPPALIIISQLVMAALIGGWGLVLSVPLLVIVMVWTKELYIKKQNGLRP